MVSPCWARTGTVDLMIWTWVGVRGGMVEVKQAGALVKMCVCVVWRMKFWCYWVSTFVCSIDFTYTIYITF
jgi:hypothetical protein